MVRVPSPAIQVQTVYAAAVLGLVCRHVSQDLIPELQRIDSQFVFAREILQNGSEERLREEEPR